jgi:esterase/lipase superfamily enzyme
MSTVLRHWLVIFIAFFVPAICSVASPALAEDKKGEALIRVPVFFITDRNLVSDTPAVGAVFGPHRKYIRECKHDPYMGLAYCVVKNTSGKTLTPKLTQAGWAPAEAHDKLGEGKAELIKANDFADIQNDFYSKVSAQALQSDHQEIVLFAHGYKNSFEAALHTAAKFSYQFETPVVLYSWPSVAKLQSYSSDENNNEWSQEHFNDVVQRMQTVCTEEPQLHVRIFAHSMGTRLVVRAVPLLREKPFVVEAALVCPDVDRGLVEHYARRYLSTKGTATIRLYMSRHDKALAFSQILHGGYNRLGECADSIAGFVTLGHNGSDPSAGNSATNISESERKAFSEIVEKTKHRMQTIDFTALDTGMIGHTIPVSVIYNMSYTNAPGPGLELKNEASGERSRTSRFFSKLTHLQAPAEAEFSEISPPETCFRVVKDGSNSKAARTAQVVPSTP